MHDQRQVGLIGLGLLGTALAERLLGAGFLVHGFDVAPERLATLTRLGGKAAQTPEELAVRSRLILCLPDSSVVAGVIGHLLPHLHAGQSILDTTTGLPEDTVRLANRLKDHGVLFGEAPLLGSSEVVRAGNALALVGGDSDWIERSSDLLAAISGRYLHLGAAGSGARMKLVVNLVLGLNRAVLAEGLSLAAAYGLDLEKTLEALRSGAAYSRAMDAKGRKMIERDYRPEAKLSQHLKDVRLILAEADRLETRTPLTQIHRELLERAQSLGFSDADNSAVQEAFRP